MNGQLLSRRRRDLGISVASLARSAGVTERLITYLEERGSMTLGDDAVSIRTLKTVAAILGIEASLLLSEQPDGEASLETGSRADAPLVANILMRVRAPVSESQLAVALGWDRRRITQAIAALHEALVAAGLRLQSVPEGMTVQPASDTRAETASADIKRSMIEEHHHTLELIWMAWRGARELLAPEQLSDADRQLADELIASHVLAFHESGGLCLNDIMWRSLAPALAGQVQFRPGEY